MNKEHCIMCGKYMGNSLNKVAGEPVHVHCMNEVEKKIKYEKISIWNRIGLFFRKLFKR